KCGLGLLSTRPVGVPVLLQALRLRLVRVLVLLEPGGDVLERLLVLAGQLPPLVRLGLPVLFGLGVSGRIGGVVLPAGLGAVLVGVGDQLLRLAVGEVQILGLVVLVLRFRHFAVLPLRAMKKPRGRCDSRAHPPLGWKSDQAISWRRASRCRRS